MIRIKDISFSYQEFENHKDLASDDLELIKAAREIAANAYSPYSGFSVGAAIRLKSGRVICGANVENAAFPSGICAERSAIANAVSNFPDDSPAEIAIAALNADGLIEVPVTPCGNCRQVIAEEEFRAESKIKIILAGREKTYIVDSISSLLPLQFNMENLKINLP